eukprot:CAMPEP_0173079002 /NCGR_PEP_ID=MMETSP1102-20130122/14716_1 /TAXON_ID=49646 /ORGANISM="Geminigera sp., Strain Caron Lab Isolate" /LENGTH=511 /DNA_ID=CAMNT_0013950905 /DNA_START=8 /DNA_END=1543 /DNA_ORIENTATION=+
MNALLDKHFINGALVPPVKGRYLDVVDPSEESVWGRSAAGTVEDVNAAVASAKNADYTWSKTSGTERAVVLRAIADAVEKNKPELADKEAVNSGKPLQEAAWDIDDVVGCFRHHADLAEALDKKQGKIVDVGMEEFETRLFWESKGVVGIIVPWNYPLLMATWKVAGALAAGCSIVLKPSELTPYTAVDLAVIAHQQAGLPAGVLNVVTGFGPDVGAPLTAHPDVEKIAFTGSTATGSRIMGTCAADIRNVSLELGGKSPIVVFDDVDIDVAVEWLMFGIFWTNGQICSATSRAIIHERIAPRVFARLQEVCAQVKACHPLTPELPDKAYIGPLISAAQYQRVLGYIEGAKREGASVLCGGGRPADAPPKGYYLAPTVITNVEPHMTIWKEEVFGPVLVVKTFSTEEQALALANDSCFGLAASVLSKDEVRAQRMVRGIKAGIAWVNCSQPCFCQAPWGGVKRSGIGRDNGEYGIESFLEVKQVTTYKTKEPWGWYIAPGFTRPAPQQSKL